jgi:hypothetical protein
MDDEKLPREAVALAVLLAMIINGRVVGSREELAREAFKQADAFGKEAEKS